MILKYPIQKTKKAKNNLNKNLEIKTNNELNFEVCRDWITQISYPSP